MSAPIFWTAFLASLLLSISLSEGLKADPMTILIVTLFWVGTAALAWHRWSGRSAAVFGRIAAGLGAAILFVSIYRWLPQTDVFVICTKNCPPRVGTFWPLLFMWAGCAWLLSYSIWGNWSDFVERRATVAFQSATWYLAILLWTAACTYVFVRNISWEVLLLSVTKPGKIIAVVALIVGGMAALFFLLTIPSRQRNKQATADFDRMTEESKRKLLQRIDSFSRRREYQVLYRPTGGASDSLTGARIGGNPAALPSEDWPKNTDGHPGLFLLQLPLDAPRLPVSWQGRFITIFLVHYGIEVRSYDATQKTALQALTNPDTKMVKRMELEALAVPYVPESDDDEVGGLSDEYLLEHVPGLKNDLHIHSKFPEKILGYLLNFSAGTNVAPEEAILVGGSPALIQDEHNAECSICRQPMRFLLQFCDVTNEQEMGDSGVGYIYGCDSHPEQCIGFVDCC